MRNEAISLLKKYGTVRSQESRLILVPNRPLPLALFNRLAQQIKGHRQVLISGPMILEYDDDAAASSTR